MKNNSFERTVKYFLFCIVLLCVSACAGLSTSKIATFGESATNAGLILNDASNLQNELNIESAILHQACRHARHADFNLGSTPKGPKSATVQQRLDFTTALLGYAQALALADDPAGVLKVREAASSFSTELTRTVASIPSSSSNSAATGPIVNLLINGIVRFDELQRRREILSIAESVDDYLFLIQRNIMNDQDQVDAFLSQRLANWESNAKCILQHVARHEPEAYRLFREFDQSKRGYLARLNAVKRSPQIYRTVANAHNDMIENPETFEQSIATINATISDLKAVVDALRGA